MATESHLGTCSHSQMRSGLNMIDPATLPLESHAVMGDTVFDMHTGKIVGYTGGIEVLGAIGRQQAEFDLQLRELRRRWLIDARTLRADAAESDRFGWFEMSQSRRAAATALRVCARQLREVLR